MKSRHRFLTAALMLAVGFSALTAWAAMPKLDLSAQHTNVLVREATRITLKPSEPLGDNARVTWKTTLGQVKETPKESSDYLPGKPSAVFSSDTPGIAIVTVTVAHPEGTSSASLEVTVSEATR
jgi:hypothetical protein